MYLIFCLTRLDVFPEGGAAVRAAIGKLYGDAAMKAQQLVTITHR